MSDLTSTLDLLVALLEDMSVQYVIVGGLAIRAYSIPRATEDLDFTLAMGREHLPGLYEALEKQDYAVPEPYRSGWVDQVKGLNLVKLKRYVGGRGIDVDLFLADSSFQKEILRRRRMADVEGRNLWIASPEDMVLLKVLAGRPRDLLDVNDVLFMQAPLDLEYLRHWASELGVEEALEKALTEHTNE